MKQQDPSASLFRAHRSVNYLRLSFIYVYHLWEFRQPALPAQAHTRSLHISCQCDIRTKYIQTYSHTSQVTYSWTSHQFQFVRFNIEATQGVFTSTQMHLWLWKDRERQKNQHNDWFTKQVHMLIRAHVYREMQLTKRERTPYSMQDHLYKNMEVHRWRTRPQNKQESSTEQISFFAIAEMTTTGHYKINGFHWHSTCNWLCSQKPARHFSHFAIGTLFSTLPAWQRLRCLTKYSLGTPTSVVRSAHTNADSYLVLTIRRH